MNEWPAIHKWKTFDMLITTIQRSLTMQLQQRGLSTIVVYCRFNCDTFKIKRDFFL